MGGASPPLQPPPVAAPSPTLCCAVPARPLPPLLPLRHRLAHAQSPTRLHHVRVSACCTGRGAHARTPAQEGMCCCPTPTSSPAGRLTTRRPPNTHGHSHFSPSPPSPPLSLVSLWSLSLSRLSSLVSLSSLITRESAPQEYLSDDLLEGRGTGTRGEVRSRQPASQPTNLRMCD